MLLMFLVRIRVGSQVKEREVKGQRERERATGLDFWMASWKWFRIFGWLLSWPLMNDVRENLERGEMEERDDEEML